MLVQVVTEFQDELNEIRDVFNDATPMRSVTCGFSEYLPLVDGCLVALWDAWSLFMRSLYLTSASGPVVGTGGATYVPFVPIPEAQALAALQVAGAVRGSGIVLSNAEPKWFLSSSARAISTCLGLANVAQIENALSQSTVQLGGGFAIPNSLGEVRRFRNYVAHKSSREAAALAALMSSGVQEVADHLQERTRGGASRFDDWLDCLIGLAWDAAL